MTGPAPNGASLVAQTVKNLPFHTVHGVLAKTEHGTKDWFPNRERSRARLYIVTLLI